MEIFYLLIAILVLARYIWILYKYWKSDFKKKIYKQNILGLIAYTFLTIFIFSFFILLTIVSKNKSSDLLMWIIILSGIGILFMYPWVWFQRMADNATTKEAQAIDIIYNDFIDKYGVGDYNTYNIKFLHIPDDFPINEAFNSLIELITNNQISVIHPNQYKNIADVLENLFQQDYIKLLNDANTLPLTCNNINSLLKRNNLDLNIKPSDISQNDDENIKINRKDLIPTARYDINQINELIKDKLNDYELVGFIINTKNKELNYPSYLGIVQQAKYDDFIQKRCH